MVKATVTAKTITLTWYKNNLQQKNVMGYADIILRTEHKK